MPSLQVSSPGPEHAEYEFGAQDVGIGREEDNHIVLDDSNVSRHHAKVCLVAGEWWLRDMGSVNGTMHAGRRVHELRLADNDTFEIGGRTFCFKLGAAESGTASRAVSPAPTPQAPPTPPGPRRPGSRRPKKKKGKHTVAAPSPPASPPLPPEEVTEVLAAPLHVASPAGETLEQASCRPAPSPPPRRASLAWAAVVCVLVSSLVAAGWSRLPAPPATAAPEAPPASVAPPEPMAPSQSELQENAAAAQPPPAGVDDRPLLPVTTPPPAAPVAAGDVGLFQPAADGTTGAPVLSPRLDHVLFVKKRSAAPDSLVDVCLDHAVIVPGVRVSTEAHLSFAQEGSAWAVHATEASGQKVIVLPDRRLQVQGELQSMVGNQDFSVIATVTRSAEEDHLHLNGVWKSSYHHISDLRLSQDGRHWAYVAVKRLDSEFSSAPAGERVVTDRGQEAVHDYIRELTLSRDGARVAYVAHRRGNVQTLFVDGQEMHALSAADDAGISSLAFSPDGTRLAWAVVPRTGPPVFHLEGAAPVVADVDGSIAAESLLSRQAAATRIVFSKDGRHVVFAAARRGAVVIRDSTVLGQYAAVQMDSLQFSPDGSRLAFVSLSPRGAINQGAGGIKAQWHSASLHVDEAVMQSTQVAVSKPPAGYPISFGGISALRFSPDSKLLGALVTSAPAPGEARRQELHVNGGKIGCRALWVGAYDWLRNDTLAVVTSQESAGAMTRMTFRVDN